MGVEKDVEWWRKVANLKWFAASGIYGLGVEHFKLTRPPETIKSNTSYHCGTRTCSRNTFLA